MNHVYRLVWNSCMGSWSVASELTAAHGKRTRSSRSVLCGAVLSVIAANANAQALPTGGEITVGQGAIQQSGNALTVTQTSQNLVINWQQFNIGEHNVVSFAQPDASAIALNRVLGADPSQILGQLNATGQVWLLNPNGVLFGQNAQVSVGGFVASTLNLSDAEFMSGRRTFSGDSAGSIINHGNIISRDGGYVALFGGRVSNQGTISARLGTVALGAGERITLDFAGDALLNVSVEQGALDALVDNRQLIRADAGQVVMTARASNVVLDSVVNNTGIIEARTVERRGGVIKLLGGFEGGTVNVAGTLDASAPESGDGGFIDTSGHKVSIDADARITTAAAEGATGTWLIDPNDYRIAASGGDITGTALAAQLASNNIVIESIDGADTVGNGDIFVNDAVSWSANTTLTLNAVRHIEVNAAITNSGNGNLVLRADMEGSGVGTVNFGGGLIDMVGGRTDLYYNPISFTAPTDYSSNITGAHTAWMLVNDVNQLQAIGTNLAGAYALGRDIDASATTNWNAGAGFHPIGDYGAFGDVPFEGMLDGLGHTIRNLFINRPSIFRGVGLFSYAYGATIRNVGLEGGEVTGDELVGFLLGRTGDFTTVSNSYATGAVSGSRWVGGLIGDIFGGSVDNSYATGAVSGDLKIGGLAGRSYGSVRDSYSTGAVSGTSDIGGLIGDNTYMGSISNSYATGTVAGSSWIGGLAGYNGGVISNSYAAGSVSGITGVGGLIGQNGGNPAIVLVSNSYAIGTVSGSTQVGGLIGYNYDSTLSNSYATGAVSGSTGVGGLIGENTNGSVIQSFWDIETSGTAAGVGIGPAAGITGLTTAQMLQESSFTGWDFGADWWLSENYTRPFLRMEYRTTIINAHQLQLMSLDLSADYVLATHLDMTELTQASGLWSITTGFVPIGDSGAAFTGTFDGLNHAIHDLFINRPATDEVGLFGATDGVTIRNIGLVDSDVTGHWSVGALVGSGTGSVSNSYASGAVSGENVVGGLVGHNAGHISNSYATGTVSGVDGIGGLAGMSTGSVSQSYASSAVNGASTVGGLLGYNVGSISQSFWDTQSSGTHAAFGDGSSVGAVGLITAQMMQEETFTAASWNISAAGGSGAVWRIYEGDTRPLLRSFLTLLTINVDDAAKTYDGVAWSGGSGLIYAGFRPGESVVNLLGTAGYGGTAQGARNAGSYTLRGAGHYSGQQGYDIEYVASTLTINKRALAIDALGLDRIYDGSTAASVTLSDNGVTGDDLTLTYSAAFADKNAGTDKAISVTSIAVSGADAANYTWNTTDSTTADIGRATLTIAAIGEDKTYDGTTLATVSLSDDRIDGDELSIGYGSAHFIDTTAGDGKRIDVLGIAVSGADAGNYLWNLSALTAADILSVDAPVPLALEAILPEIVRSESSPAQDLILINRGIRLPEGLVGDAVQEPVADLLLRTP